MRFLHLNNEKTWRGGERQTLLTAVEQRRLGVAAHIACRVGSPLEKNARAAGVPVIPLSRFLPTLLTKLFFVLPKFDLLHCHTGRGHSLGTLVTLLRPKPLLVSRRVDFVPAKSWFNRLKYRRADQIICVSQSIAKLLCDWGVNPQKVLVIYDAVPDQGWLPREICLAQLRERTGLPVGKRIVGNIAALVPHKDQATLIRAASQVVAHRADVAFVIIGEGALKNDLYRLRAELALEKDVLFTGFIPEAQRLLPGFDVFAMSSNMEGLGTIVLDAQSAGVPVATTAAGGLPELVQDQQTGLLAEVGNPMSLAAAILRLLADEPLAARLATAALDRIRAEFSVTEMAQKYLAIYEVILGTTQRTSR